jgi:hypothetical protein
MRGLQGISVVRAVCAYCWRYLDVSLMSLLSECFDVLFTATIVLTRANLARSLVSYQNRLT